MNAKSATALLFVGLLVGVVGAYFGRQFLEPYLPGSMQDRAAGMTGLVVAKRLEGDRLLITVAAQEGASLVTFRKRVSEIDLLVQENDTVTLGIKSYRPFVEDPELQAVRKPDFGEPPSAEPERQEPKLTPGVLPKTTPTPPASASEDSLPNFGTRR